jgi:hypothetical protein
MSVTIERADTGRSLRRFIGLPAEIYREYSEYVAPLRMDRNGIFDPRKGAFFRSGRAAYFLALRDGRPVGRISAQIAPTLPAGLSRGTGQFGALDAREDPEAIAALITAAEGWLSAEGCQAAFGPVSLNMNEEPGLMVSGQGEPPMTMVPWHPPHLRAGLEQAGYRTVKTIHMWRLDNSPEMQARLAGITRINAGRLGLTIRGIDMKNLAHELALMCEVYNDAWRENWGFLPLDQRDLAGVEKELKPFMKSDAGVFVERNGKLVAVLLMLPNMFELTGDLGMDPSPLGWLKLGMRSLRPRFRSGRIILMGVSGAARGSIGGAAIAMTLIDEVLRRFSGAPWTHIEAGWVLEDNTALVRLLEQTGFQRTKTFQLYEKRFIKSVKQERESAT